MPQIQDLVSSLSPAELEPIMAAFARGGSTEDRVSAVRGALSASGSVWRDQIGQWIADVLSVETLVPDAYANWRPLVHHAMAFVASHISDERLAPKVVEQVELPPDTSAEVRLGLVIAKTPGLQKLGQVLARTRGLSPSLRTELQKLENGISDVNVEEIREIIQQQIQKSLQAYKVHIAAKLLSEASVSAILPFTWFNPSTGKREEGVFKVMKPHVPDCYAEDLALLQDLAQDLAARGSEYHIASRQVVETLDEVRLLLEREVDFRREQATLAEVARVYPRRGVHAPAVIAQLCTDTITAMSLERGEKVTDAVRHSPSRRRRLATRIVEALIADPMFSPEDNALFHADPHAGNLLYDEKKGQLIVLDWALTGRLTLEERRQVAKLMTVMTFRDAEGVRSAIHALSRSSAQDRAAHARIIDESVDGFFANLPHAASLGAMDAMRLLDSIGVDGVRFPASLVLIRKVMFTLDGVLNDIAGDEVKIDTVVAREFLSRWFRQGGMLPSPFRLADFLAVQRSALAYISGFWIFSQPSTAVVSGGEALGDNRIG